MTYNPIIASLTIAFGALAALAAMIWQVTHGHEADAQLAGLVGLLFGAFLRMPGQVDQVTIRQPVDQPVPVKDDDGHIGPVEAIVIAFIAVLVFVVLVRYV